MGLRSRFKKRLKDALENVKALSKVVAEEANHPGRPQPHMAARNPSWGGQENTAENAGEKPSSKPKKSNVSASDDGDFWYLRDDNEGWDDPNPGNDEA